MNRDNVYRVVVGVVFSIIAVWMLQINPIIVIVIFGLYILYILYRNDSMFEQKIQMESNQLLSKIKTSSSDAYLKQKQLYTLVANIPIPLILLDEQGKVVLYNEKFERFRNGDNQRDFTHVDNDFDKKVDKFITDAYLFEREIDKTMNVNGIEYEAIGVPITTNKRFSGCVVLFQDISRAMEKEQMQKQFVADASHELKTPISAIKGMVEILNRDGFDDSETQEEFLVQIQKETERLEIIVRDLLRLSRLSVDNVVLKRESIDFTTIIDRSVDTLQQKADMKDITIHKEYKSHEKVFVDDEQMEIVVNNLLANAINYSETGNIYLRTYKEDEGFVFEIEDEGCGIAQEDINKVFERFYRIDKARSRLSGGSGLGLSIVKTIIEAHDAKLEVTSELNKGSIFKIYMKY